MAYKDLRQWIGALEAEGELRRIGVEVDWRGELQAVTRRILDRRGPALLFESIKDYRHTLSTQLFTGGLATPSRVALMLGCPPRTPFRELVQVIRQRLKGRVPPVRVEAGPVKEQILKGEEVDLFQLPVPMWHREDGGRYILTFCAVITRDPESGIQNVGMYRGMIVDRNRISVLLLAQQHWGVHFAKYRERGQAMPVAVAIGCEPTVGFLAGAAMPPNTCEYDIMGSIRQEPVELVPCETSDLEVPAHVELVLEGSISPDPETFAWEGPFGEFTGYFGGERSRQPVIQVECLTHRRQPIYRGTAEGRGPGHHSEAGSMSQVSVSAQVWDALETAGVPGISDVYILPPSAVTNVAIQIHKTYRGQAKQVAMAVWGSSVAASRCKNIIVVDDDIDIYSFEALEWAIAYRVNPCENDLVIIPGTPYNSLDPATRLQERDPRRYGAGKANRLLVDATKNWEYERRPEWGNDMYPPVAVTLPPEDQELVRRRWHEYGLAGILPYDGVP